MKFKLSMVGLIVLVFAAFDCANEVVGPHDSDEALDFSVGPLQESF